jgi:hypothetical protein
VIGGTYSTHTFYFILYQNALIANELCRFPWMEQIQASRILLENFTVADLIIKFPMFYVIRMFITIFTEVHLWTLS